MYRDIPEELRILIEPVVADAGLELVDVSLARGGRPWSLRITVDTLIGDGRVSVDHCVRVARELGTQLDVADAIESTYRLEVSSPGLDRVLAREKDFASVCGSEVQVETKNPVAGRRRFRGVLLSFEDNIASIDVDGAESKVPFAEVSKAKLLYEFSAADFNERDHEHKNERMPAGKRHGKGDETNSGGRRGHSSGSKAAGRTSGRTAEIDG
ncbi:MAG: ribosome maturation factor RimP [Myxococcota bacterium]